MKRRMIWTLVIAALVANGALLIQRAPLEAQRAYIDCFWFPGGAGCTNAVYDGCDDIYEDCL